MALHTTVEHAEGRVPVEVLTLAGELDASSFEGVIATVRDIYANGGRHLVMDVSDLTFIASSGLVALHSSLRLMRGEDPPDPEYGWAAMRAVTDEASGANPQTNIRLSGTQDAIQKVLDRTGLAALFPSYPDRAAAIAAF